MEFLRAINALMNRGSFFIASAQLQSRIINAIHNKGGNALLCCKPLAYTHATRKFPTGRRIASTACVPSQAPFPQVSTK